MHAKPDLRVFLKWMIAGSGSVIVDVELNRIAAGDWLASLLLSLGFVRAEFDLLSSFAIVLKENASSFGPNSRFSVGSSFADCDD